METNATQPFFPRETRPRSCIATICPAHNPIYGPAGRPARKRCVPRRCPYTGKTLEASRHLKGYPVRRTVDVGQSVPAEGGHPSRRATLTLVGAASDPV